MCPRDLFQSVSMAVFHISDLLSLLFGILGISYTRRGLLCEGLYSQNVDGGYALLEFLQDDRESCETNLHFSFVVPQVSIFCYFGILNDISDPPTKGGEGIVFMCD